MINNGILFDNNEVSFPDDAAWSRGISLETASRRCKDYSKTPQDLIRRRFTKASDYTCSFNLNHYNCSDFILSIYKLEDSVGHTGTMIRAGQNRGRVIVQSVSFAIDVDGLGSISAVGVTVQLSEARIPVKASSAEIRTLS